MRAIAWVIGIVAVIALLIWLGVGQGLNACLEDCRIEHCGAVDMPLEKCDRTAYDPCKDACYATHRGGD